MTEQPCTRACCHVQLCSSIVITIHCGLIAEAIPICTPWPRETLCSSATWRSPESNLHFGPRYTACLSISSPSSQVTAMETTSSAESAMSRSKRKKVASHGVVNDGVFEMKFFVPSCLRGEFLCYHRKRWRLT